jgi:RNA polymerase sigma-B factor
MGCMEAATIDREGLFATYCYLCRRGARKFLRRGLERADLEQVAAIGLVKACERYDDRLGIPFEAYAWRMILGELGHHVRAHEHLVRPPRKLQALERRYWTEWERLCSALDREPSDAELADAMETTSEVIGEIRELRLLLHGACRGDTDFLDASRSIWAGTPGLDVDELFCLRKGLAALSTLERQIVIGTYWCGLPRTMLARKLGVPPNAIARLRAKAVRRLREYYAAA